MVDAGVAEYDNTVDFIQKWVSLLVAFCEFNFLISTHDDSL